MALNGLDATTPQLKLIESLVKAYLTLDLKNVEPFTSKDYTFQTFPKIPDLPDETKWEHFERYQAMFSLMTKVELNFHEVIDAPGKVVLHASAMLNTVEGDKLDYDSLCVLTLVEENGELKVSEFKDFSDPEKRANLHTWVAKALAKRAL